MEGGNSGDHYSPTGQALRKISEAEQKNQFVAQSFLLDLNKKQAKIDDIVNIIAVEKLKILRLLLVSATMDEENSVGSDQKLKNAFTESEMDTIKEKIFEIINEL